MTNILNLVQVEPITTHLLHSSSNALLFFFSEDGKVKVENVSKVDTKDTDGQEKEKLDKEKNDDEGSRGKDEKEEKSESPKKEKDEDDKKTVASENILSLLNQLEESEGTNNAKTEVSSKPPSLPQTADSNSRRIDQSGTPQRNSKGDYD